MKVLPFGEDGPKIEGRSSDGSWRCNALLAKDADGRLSISRLEVEPWTFGDRLALGTNVLRSLPLGRWLASAHSQLGDAGVWLKTGTLAGSVEGRAWAQAAAESARSTELRRGRRGYPEDHYRRIALAYLALQQQGVRGSPVRLAQDESTPARPVAWQTMRDWIHRATELGFLSPGSPGRAGRSPGPNLYKEVPE
jgi:hypothetical protein